MTKEFLKNKKYFIASSLAAVVLFPFFIFSLEDTITSLNAQETPKKQEYLRTDPLTTIIVDQFTDIKQPFINKNNPSLGKADAPITIVEYSDFECKFCQEQEKTIKKIMDSYNDKIRLIWKDYPIKSPTSPSYQAALAGRCAQAEGKFWPFHDRLFTIKKNLNQEAFFEIAASLKISENSFKRCLENREKEDLIQEDIAEADALRITGIPFIYINDKEIMGEISFAELKNIIDLELRK